MSVERPAEHPGITEKNLRERYDCGCCMYLAIALHEATGLLIEAVIDPNDGEPYIAHAFVVDGQHAIDAIGSYPAHLARSDFMHGNRFWHRFSVDELRAYIRCDENEYQASLDEARSVVRYFYADFAKVVNHRNGCAA